MEKEKTPTAMADVLYYVTVGAYRTKMEACKVGVKIQEALQLSDECIDVQVFYGVQW
ncbi:hypothetical protein [Phascolarctobacterium sp.]|uniref:hypothetical protein n=1 Tax=Phascolarctobacterium sp. TaxID=2049039 RepID=UPI00386F8C78